MFPAVFKNYHQVLTYILTFIDRYVQPLTSLIDMSLWQQIDVTNVKIDFIIWVTVPSIVLRVFCFIVIFYDLIVVSMTNDSSIWQNLVGFEYKIESRQGLFIIIIVSVVKARDKYKIWVVNGFLTIFCLWWPFAVTWSYLWLEVFNLKFPKKLIKYHTKVDGYVKVNVFV